MIFSSVEAVEARLLLLDELRLELRVAVSRHVLHLAALAAHRLQRGAVARVARVIAGGVVALVAEVMSQLAVEGVLDECLHELLEQSILTEQVVGLLVIPE